LGLLERIKKLKLPSLRKKTVKIAAPQQWLEGKQKISVPAPKGETVTLEAVRRGKRRIPGLRIFNQVLAVLLLIANFFISQAALMSMTPEIALLFLGNSYIALWGLWKSRKERQQLEI